MASQFFITLPSNAKSDVKNTASQFRVQLPYRLVLQGDWECALCEFIYPNTWFNVTTDDNLIQFYDIPNKTLHKLKIPSTRYETVIDLVESIQASLKILTEQENVPYTQYIKIKYNHLARVVVLRVNLTVIKSFCLPEKLMYLLGFDKNQFETDNPDKLKIVANHPPDMKAGLEAIYVYCNIVEPQIAGDVIAPLLRIVNIEGKFGDIVDKVYDSPHYIPVQIKDISDIEVSIKTDINELMHFIYGKTIVKIHFRKKAYF